MKKLFSILVLSILLFTGCTSKNDSKYLVNDDFKGDVKTYQNITYKEFKEKMDKGDSFVILLWQTGCSHCKAFEPKLNEIVESLSIKIYGLNTAELSSEEYAIIKNKTFITGTPTTVYFKDGKFEDSLVGNKNVEDVLNFLKNNNIIKEK